MTSAVKSQAPQSSRVANLSPSVRLQIECNASKPTQQKCFLCHHSFELKEARVMVVCDQLGDSYGDICPHCLAAGSGFIWSQISKRVNKPLIRL